MTTWDKIALISGHCDYTNSRHWMCLLPRPPRRGFTAAAHPDHSLDGNSQLHAPFFVAVA